MHLYFEAMTPKWKSKDRCTCEECLEANSAGRDGLDILVDWVTTVDNVSGKYVNWAHYKGGAKRKTGRSKTTIHTELSVLLTKHGFARDADAVKNKLIDMTSQFNKAQDWLHATGAGLREQDESQLYVSTHYQHSWLILNGPVQQRPNSR